MSTLDEVAEDFRLAIADLTSPARHIITSLTSIAAEQTDFAPAIVEVIEERIRKAAPKHLLPTLYLLDSVVKNVGGVYIELFAKNLYGIVTLALKRSVDDAKAQKAIPRMIGTWHGVFSEDLVALLEKYLSSSTQAPTSKQPSMPMYTQQQPIPFYPVPQVPPPIQQPAMFPQPNLSHVQSVRFIADFVVNDVGNVDFGLFGWSEYIFGTAAAASTAPGDTSSAASRQQTPRLQKKSSDSKAGRVRSLKSHTGQCIIGTVH